MGRVVFVMVHGAWHAGWSFGLVAPRLVAAGHHVVAPDLPGNGVHAAIPATAHADPYDPGAFATEVTESAKVTLENQADAVVALVDEVAAGGLGPVVLLGHSMGGHVITQVAERIPERLARLVYLSGFMPASGVPAVAYIQSPENAGERVGPLFQADPEVVGALRIHPSSPDPAHRRGIMAAFAGTVPAERHAAILNLMTPDLPIQVPTSATTTTAERWGAVPRTYIRCARDEAVLPACQDRMIAEADAVTPDTPTEVLDLDTCHSPFFADPDRLATMLVGVADRVA